MARHSRIGHPLFKPFVQRIHLGVAYVVRCYPIVLLRIVLPVSFGVEFTSDSSSGQCNDRAGRHGSWKVLYEENFEDGAALFKTGSPPWVSDTYQNTDEYSDGGAHFKGLGVTPPVAFRAEGPFGKDGWLSVAAYSRSNLTKFSDLFEVVPDPADPNNHVLKISSPKHTDGTVVRPTKCTAKEVPGLPEGGLCFVWRRQAWRQSEWLCRGRN